MPLADSKLPPSWSPWLVSAARAAAARPLRSAGRVPAWGSKRPARPSGAGYAAGSLCAKFANPPLAAIAGNGGSPGAACASTPACGATAAANTAASVPLAVPAQLRLCNNKADASGSACGEGVASAAGSSVGTAAVGGALPIGSIDVASSAIKEGAAPSPLASPAPVCGFAVLAVGEAGAALAPLLSMLMVLPGCQGRSAGGGVAAPQTHLAAFARDRPAL